MELSLGGYENSGKVQALFTAAYEMEVNVLGQGMG